MRIIFINPWTKSLFGDDRQTTGYPHLGLAYLIAVCKKNGYKDIKVFDQGVENNDKVLYDMISSFRPHIIGITSYSYCYQYAKDLIGNIKNNYPRIIVIVGGPHISATKGYVLETTKTDFAMKNESELSFISFLKELEKPHPDYSKVKNLIWRDKQRVIENEPGEFVQNLDSLPLPDYEVFDFKRYSSYKARLIHIITSRGCPYGCNYCSVKLSMGRGFRARSPENVISEMRHWMEKFGIEHFEINDDCFALDIKRAEGICEAIIKENLNIKYEIYNGIRADHVSESLLHKMKESGCVFVAYGCESGNQDIINKHIGKNLDLKKVVEAVNLTNRIGIRNSVNFIIGHPGETFDTAMQTLHFADSLPTNFVNIYNLIPYPGTKLFEWIAKNARLLMPVEEYSASVGSRDLNPIFETPEFTREERIRILRKGYSLYEKKILQFRFGKIFGYIFYLLTRNRFVFVAGRKFAFDSGIGSRIYRKLTEKSRK